MADPLRSAIGINSAEDTSLVLPSDKKHCTGQQRVLQQVHSIKRNKSKKVKNDDLLSPTSPQSATEYSEPKFQFSPTTLNGSLYRKSSTNMSRRHSRMNGHGLSVRKTVRKTQSTGLWEPQIIVQSMSSGMKNSGSDPALNQPGTQISQKSFLSRAATVNVKSLNSTHSMTKVRSKSESSGLNRATGAVPNITLKKAVEYLKHSEVSYQLCGATVIQHNTYTNNEAKQEVCELGAIPDLIHLLKSDDSQLQQTAAAALRNIVFKNAENKLKVDRCEGLEIILNALENTNEMETQKQLTGLLWNLSSADSLKPQIIGIGLLPLTKNIVVPYNLCSDSNNTNKYIDPEVFYNTTGCIRNLSCGDEKDRILMRNCKGLIDSLMTYIQCQVDRGMPDDKSVENCVCILHNLSYQLEKEAPEHFKQFTPNELPPEHMSRNKSLFSPKSSRKTQTRKQVTIPAMESDPKGVTWLYHTKSLRMYLSLLSSSQKEGTLEACCGALQNLTASKNPVSTLMSETIAEKLNGLHLIPPLLHSTHPGLQKTAMSLLGNMSRVESLRDCMAKMVLPHVSSVLSSANLDITNSENTIVTACRVMHTLALAEPEHGKKVLKENLIDSLSELSKNPDDSIRRSAGVLLYCLWKEKDFHSLLKKQGWNKDTFINEVTAASYKRATDANHK